MSLLFYFIRFGRLHITYWWLRISINSFCIQCHVIRYWLDQVFSNDYSMMATQKIISYRKDIVIMLMAHTGNICCNGSISLFSRNVASSAKERLVIFRYQMYFNKFILCVYLVSKKRKTISYQILTQRHWMSSKNINLQYSNWKCFLKTWFKNHIVFVTSVK